MKNKLSHPLGKTIPHNTAGSASKGAAPSGAGASAEQAMKALKTTTKLARYGAQGATSDVGGPAFTRPI